MNELLIGIAASAIGGLIVVFISKVVDMYGGTRKHKKSRR